MPADKSYESVKSFVCDDCNALTFPGNMIHFQEFNYLYHIH